MSPPRCAQHAATSHKIGHARQKEMANGPKSDVPSLPCDINAAESQEACTTSMTAQREKGNGRGNRISACNPNGHWCQDDSVARHHELLLSFYGDEWILCELCQKWRILEGDAPKDPQWTCEKEWGEHGCERDEDSRWYNAKCFSGITDVTTYNEEEARREGTSMSSISCGRVL